MSAINIRSEITRLRDVDLRRNPDEARTGPVSREQILANTLTKIADAIDALNVEVQAVKKRLTAAGL